MVAGGAGGTEKAVGGQPTGDGEAGTELAPAGGGTEKGGGGGIGTEPREEWNGVEWVELANAIRNFGTWTG